MLRRTKYIVSVVLIAILSQNAHCQTNGVNDKPKTIIINGDTMISYEAKPILILPSPVFASNEDLLKFKKLVRNVKVVYPYAKQAKILIKEIENSLDSITNKKERSRFIKEKEKALFSRYQKEIEKLSVTQGRLLMKLLDREVNKTTYEIIKELRGGLEAFMWQQMAKLFGSDLKTGYDAKGEDRMIEKIIILIENGQL